MYVRTSPCNHGQHEGSRCQADPTPQRAPAIHMFKNSVRILNPQSRSWRGQSVRMMASKPAARKSVGKRRTATRGCGFATEPMHHSLDPPASIARWSTPALKSCPGPLAPGRAQWCGVCSCPNHCRSHPSQTHDVYGIVKKVGCSHACHIRWSGPGGPAR